MAGQLEGHVGPKTYENKGVDQLKSTLDKEMRGCNQTFGQEVTFTGVSAEQFAQLKETIDKSQSSRAGPSMKLKYDASKQTMRCQRQDHIRSVLQPIFWHILGGHLKTKAIDSRFSEVGRMAFGNAKDQGEADVAWIEESEEKDPNKRQWPSGVLEVGYDSVTPNLDQDIAYWTEKSKGQVHAVFGIQVSAKGEVVVTHYESNHDSKSPKYNLTNTVVVKPPPGEKQPGQVSGAPLKFTPSVNTQDTTIEFGEMDFLRIAEEVWFVLRDQLPVPGVWTLEGGKLPRPES